MINSFKKAITLIKKFGDQDRFLIHIKLVGEAADILLRKLKKMGVETNENLVKIGVAVHDAGKIVHPEELSEAGHHHEPAGMELLLKNGVQPEVARFSLSHARWREKACTFEELLVALADNLWKGKRVPELELKIIDHVARKLKKDRWDLFTELDSLFESIAANGPNRLLRSR